MTEVAADADPRQAIRTVALGVFDAIDAHPWAGALLSRTPSLVAMPQMFEGFGEQLQALEVPERAQFDSASALVSYTLGVAGQNAANAHLFPHGGTDRAAFLGEAAAQWMQLDPTRYSFVHKVAAQLPEHDDRAQFLAGIDLILAGIEALTP